MRILSDPSSVEGGAVAAPAETKAQTPAPAKIQIDPEEFASLYRRATEAENILRQREEAEREAVEKANQEKLKAIGEKEGLEKALAEQNRQWQEKYEAADKARRDLDSRFLGEKKANAIGDAMAGFDFISPAAERQAREFLNQRFGVERDESGKVHVRDSATGRFAAEIVPELLKSDEFAHFLKPSTTGGSGAGQKAQPPAGGEVEEDPFIALGKFDQRRQGRYGSIGIRPVSVN